MVRPLAPIKVDKAHPDVSRKENKKNARPRAEAPHEPVAPERRGADRDGRAVAEGVPLDAAVEEEPVAVVGPHDVRGRLDP